MLRIPCPTAVFSAAILSLCALPLHADDPKPEEKKDAAEKKDEKKEKPDDKAKEQKTKESKGSVKIAGAEITYAAKAGKIGRAHV